MLLAIASTVRSASGPAEGAEAIGSLLECSFELAQGSCGLPYLEEQFGQQFAERIGAVLHGNVFEASIFSVSCRPHEP